jgi:hypothetical protein
MNTRRAGCRGQGPAQRKRIPTLARRAEALRWLSSRQQGRRGRRCGYLGTPLVIEPSPGQLASDAGLLPVRPIDQCVGPTRAFADTLDDPRDPDLTEHTFPEMVLARVYGILAEPLPVLVP